MLAAPDESKFTENQIQAIIAKTYQMLVSPIVQIHKILAKPLLSLPLDYCTAPVKMFDDFLPFFADHELPYYVPDPYSRLNEQSFAPEKDNVVIEKWAESPSISILFRGSDKNLSSIVKTTLRNSKIRTIINGTSDQSNKLEWEFAFRKVDLFNITDTGAIKVHLLYDHDEYPLRNNVSVSTLESYELKSKLQCIIAESFKNLTKTK